MSLVAAGGDAPEVEQFLSRVSGRLAFDIGANTGQVTVGLAQRFVRVAAFEPAEESYIQLAALNLSNVNVAQVALSDHDGAVTLDVQEHPIRSGQLTTGGYAGWGRVLGHRMVRCRTLDSLTDVYGIPDFIKIDVEGHELAVIRGGLDTLTRHAPRLCTEVHDPELGTEIIELLSPVYGSRLHEVHDRERSWLVAQKEG